MKIMIKVIRMLALLVNSLAVFALLAFPFAQAALAETNTTFTVNASTDVVDFLPGDGVCETAPGNGMCTLRAAIMEANAHVGADTITLPASTYHLTILGADEDQSATGDLDITESLTITGGGSDHTDIDADGLNDRVLDISSDAEEVTISGVKIKNGRATTGGGGISAWAALSLSNVSLENNFSLGYGGAIYSSEPLTLTHVIVQQNSAEGGGGGISSSLDGLSIEDSQFYNNSAEASGGAILIPVNAPVHIVRTDFSSNWAFVDGGTIHNSGELLLEDSTISNSHVGNAGGGIVINNNANATLTNVSIMSNHAVMVGGGIWIAPDATLTGENLLFDSNSTDHYGGAINSQGTVQLQRSVLRDNRADHGGAIITNPGSSTTIAQSTIISNTATASGGGIAINGSMTLDGVTLNENQSPYGGAIYNSGTLWMENSTVSQNSAGEQGGGIYNFSEASIANSTITGNLAGTNSLPPVGVGGGVFAPNTADTYFRNTILFGNHHRILMDWVDDDCYGSMSSGDYNLVGTLEGCTLIDLVGHNLIGIEPLLGELADNGGPTQTHALLDDSPAIDGGNPGGCLGIDNTPLVTDQRGVARPLDGDRDGTATCDIGAYELVTYTFVYLPIIER